MTSNPVYDAIEDELVRALEQGAVLPSRFAVTLAEDEFLALIAGGLQSPGSKTRMPHTVTRVWLKLAGHHVLVRSEKDTEDLELTPDPT